MAFGPREEIEQVRKRIAAAHARVRGPGYSAFDRDAQLWVLATLIMGSVSMFERFIRPLEETELNDFLQENRSFGEVFGLPAESLPTDWTAFKSYWEMMLHAPLLGSDPLCAEVANAILHPRTPLIMRSLAPVFRALAMAFIPTPLQVRLQLEGATLHKPTWGLLDMLLPQILPISPNKIRFAPAFLKAVASRD